MSNLDIDPDDCILFFNIKTGYVLQYLTAAVSKMQSGRIRINVNKNGIHFQAEKTLSKSSGKLLSCALLDAYFEQDRLEKFSYNHPSEAISIELNGKHLSDQFKKFKRKERAVVYIPKGKNPDTMFIYAESTVVKEVAFGVEHSITIALYDTPIAFTDTDTIEYIEHDDGKEEKIYENSISVDSSHFDRAKNVGGSGDFLVTIQGSNCIMFEKQNKKMYSGKVCIGKLNNKKSKYVGTFSADIFDIIMIMVKIKKPVIFYTPTPKYTDNYPLKVSIPLEWVGTCTLFIKTNEQIEAEKKKND